MKDILAKAIYKYHLKELQTPNEIFDFLLSNNFFESKQATEAYIRTITSFFGLEEKRTKEFFQMKIIDSISEETNYGSPQEVFDYLTKINFFFDDNDAKIKFLHLAEQESAK